MSSRTRPRRSGSIQLDIRMRRMARRASADLRSTPNVAHPPSSDIGAERKLIVERIATLKAELTEQQRHLQAIDLLLAVDPMAGDLQGNETASHRRPSDVLDVEYTVIR